MRPSQKCGGRFCFVVEVVLLAMKRWDFETSTAVIFYSEMLI